MAIEYKEIGTVYYCPKHKEYFFDNCSNCMVDINEPDIIKRAKSEARKEIVEKIKMLENNNICSKEYEVVELFRQQLLAQLEGNDD